MGRGAGGTVAADRSPIRPGGAATAVAGRCARAAGAGRPGKRSPEGATPRQLAEYAGLDSPAGLQHLPNRARWEADEVRDDVQAYVAERLGTDDGVLVVDETGS
ncbi:hypothetical protein GCM10010405_44100 [Streptomyces macrosporus]|uniref:Transposase n=1 Tax=Streptomyces macrosporus TaxID=44032 RepID=A0ABP5XLV1_9ACTN